MCSIFARIEALLEQHKRLLLHLVKANIITLPEGAAEALSERLYAVKDNGAVVEREQYLNLPRKLRAVYRAAGEGFGEALAADFGGQGWEAFHSAIRVRDRLTHPKTFDDCQVDDDLQQIDEAEVWYRALNNEFVRIARAYRAAHPW